ncbi:MAG: bifunctional folylpolyglutamate synthase/dihydrofolate synthase [Terracidiphilus sp.]
MSYAAAIDLLNAMVPELYTRAGQQRRKFSLDEVGTLLAGLDDPQRRFPSLLIAGTNGKGSTAATLASILTASGVRTGLYTSPHLSRVNERIRIDQSEIPDEAFARIFFRVQDTARALVGSGRLPQLPSFFEVLTALALSFFAEAGVGLAVLEVGMGGRLDATNIVDPLLSIVTDISLDHTEWLGSTIAAIAREKAGILRRGGTLVTLPQLPEANQVLGETAEALQARRMDASAYLPPPGSNPALPYRIQALGAPIEIASPLLGQHQHRNAALAVAAAVELASTHGFAVTPATIAEGIRQTRWPGRLERITMGGVEWILDVAHNPAGARALRAGLTALNGELHARQPWTLVFSCLRDKPVEELAQILFPLFQRVILAPIHSSRAISMDSLRAAAEAVGSSACCAGSIHQALGWAKEDGQEGVVVVSGSVYLVGEARSLLMAGEFA